MNGVENLTIISNDDQPTSQSTTIIGLQDLSHPLSVSMITSICSSMTGSPSSTYSSQNVDHYPENQRQKETAYDDGGGHCDYEYCTSQTAVDNNNIDRNKKFSFSSIASVSDSGNESFIDEDPGDASSSNETIFGEYFDQNQDHKMVKLAGKNQTPFSCVDEFYISDDEEGESTLSESSYPSSPAEYDHLTPLSDDAVFDFETVCAAIDEKLIKLETNKANDSSIEQCDEQKQQQNQSQFDESSETIEGRGLPGGENRRNSFLIRSTSLKSGKTPPGTPGGKKMVRFADALGLDLASVRHIVYDQPYVPPLAAYKSLELDDEDRDWLLKSHQDHSTGHGHENPNKSQGNSQIIAATTLRMLFDQPSSDPLNFLERVRSNKVHLENCILSGPTTNVGNVFTLTCVVRVLNVCFNKKVSLRYTTNEWLKWTEVPGEYVPNSHDGFSDKFTIVVELAVDSNGHQKMKPGQRLLFAIRFFTDCNEEYWDNNNGMNYAMIYQRC